MKKLILATALFVLPSLSAMAEPRVVIDPIIRIEDSRERNFRDMQRDNDRRAQEEIRREEDRRRIWMIQFKQRYGIQTYERYCPYGYDRMGPGPMGPRR